MGYLKEFQTQIASRDFAKFMQLYEEYCTCDTADVDELIQFLNSVKSSDFAKPFGKHVETLLPLIETITNEEERYAILRLLIDLQSVNTANLADLTLAALQKRYHQDPEFSDKLRLTGLRTKENFQGAISNFDLLSHIKKGNFVFHPSGWGAGEIMDHSVIREQLSVEFENVSGLKSITFSNAFKTLVPLHSSHFLARRFSDADAFEKEAKESPLEVIKCLLRDLGPKNASEIKDELCELVIPEKDWQKWWQNARAKIKKDTEIESPVNIRDPFILRKVALSHETKFLDELKGIKAIPDLLLHCYNFTRDHAGKLKLAEIKEAIIGRLEAALKREGITQAQVLQIYFCLDAVSGNQHEADIAKLIQREEALESLIEQIDVVAYKKLALVAIKTHRKDWPKSFLSLLKTVSQGLLRDYLFKELLKSEFSELLKSGLKSLVDDPAQDPEFFFWYFLKIMQETEEKLPFGDKAGQCQFAEGLLVLLNRIENVSGYKDLVKKIYVALSSKRYALVRQIFDGSELDFVKEFLLLATKCHTITDHDLKILRALSEVVHPSLEKADKHKKSGSFDPHVIWTTQEGYQKTQGRIQQIGTKEIIENAREVEAARALGDLRENSEYKYAVEKRGRLQGELKNLSEQLSKARVITPHDISPDEVGIGSCVHAVDSKGNRFKVTILGPWEADPENNVLSYQSKVAQSMMGSHVDDTFKFMDDECKIVEISSIFSENS